MCNPQRTHKGPLPFQHTNKAARLYSQHTVSRGCKVHTGLGTQRQPQPQMLQCNLRGAHIVTAAKHTLVHPLLRWRTVSQDTLPPECSAECACQDQRSLTPSLHRWAQRTGCRCQHLHTTYPSCHAKVQAPSCMASSCMLTCPLFFVIATADPQ